MTLDSFDPTPKNPVITDGDFFDARVAVPDVMPSASAAASAEPNADGRVLKAGDACEKLLVLIAQRGSASRSELASELGISARRLKELVDLGLVIREGAGRSVRYRLP